MARAAPPRLVRRQANACRERSATPVSAWTPELPANDDGLAGGGPDAVGGVRVVAGRCRLIGKREPSPRQQQIVDTVVEHGSVAAAATALAVSCLTVDRAISAYHQRVCDRRLAELEAELARVRDKVQMDRAARRLERVVGRIERAVMPVSHRRLADGGTHARDHRKRSA